MGKSLGSWRCPLCGAQVVVHSDKKGKPYIQCNPCGMQVFVRGTQGIGLLDQRMKLHAGGGSIGSGDQIPVPVGIQFERIQELADLAGLKESISGSKLSKPDQKLALVHIDRRAAELRDLLNVD